MAEPSHSIIIPMPQWADQWITAEKRLNDFAGTVALMERVGNCLGSLAFTWATVVVLGGFSTNLGQDFWYATAIGFLEAYRVFGGESRSDDTARLKLKRVKLARGIPYYLTPAIVIVCTYGTLDVTLTYYGFLPPPNIRLQYNILLLSVLLALASVAQFPTFAEYLKDNYWLQFLCSLVAVLALVAAMLWSRHSWHEVLLIIPPLFFGCLQIVVKPIGDFLKISGYHLGLYQFRAWLSTLAALILPVWVIISVLIAFRYMGVLILLGTLMLRNIQIPVAVPRIVLSSERLFTRHNSSVTADNPHLALALTIFYSMVLAQGILYLAACIIESLLSFHFRRSLARSCKLNYRTGYDSINLYYEHAYKKCMDEGVLAQDMNLVTFAFNSLDSNSNDKKLAAVQILYSLLQLHGPSNRRLIAQITTNTKVVASLINMLVWTASDDEQGISIRLFAAKIIASLAGDLRIVGIPGAMQMVSSLLNVDPKNHDAKQDISNKISNKKEVNIVNDNPQQSHDSSTKVDMQGEHGYHAPANGQQSSKQLEAGHKSKLSYQKSKFLKWFNNLLHGPEEGKETSKDIDLFPVLGMQIIERLAHNVDNIAEISKATGLIPKIIGFIINSTDSSNKIMASSFNLVAKLASTEGEIGVIIRQKILEKPFFLSNLVEILVDNCSHRDQLKPMMVIIVKLMFEDETSKDIKTFHVLIPKLVQAFFDQDESHDPDFRLVVGEALSKLVLENTSFCIDILQEKGYGLFEDLKNMLQHDEYTDVATSLLTNLCAHALDKMDNRRLSEHLSSVLQVVLEKMVDAEGKQLEVLIITALHLYNIIPGQFAYELDSCSNEDKLVGKLVDALNSNKKMCNECPRIRKVIVEITIRIVESCPRYSTIFQNKRMMEALAKEERTLAEVKKYRTLLGKAGDFFDSGLPPPDLVIKAKRIIGETPSQEAEVHGLSLLDIVHAD